MSDSSLTHALPTPSSRLVSWYAINPAIKNERSIMIRDPHTATAFQNLSNFYSRGVWQDLRLDIVPIATCVGYAVNLAVAWTHGNRTPSTFTEICELPGVHHFSFGSLDSLPPAFPVHCSFQDTFASDLLKPAPVEGARPRFVMYFTAHKLENGSARALDDIEKKSDSIFFQVHVRGHLSFSGAE